MKKLTLIGAILLLTIVIIIQLPGSHKKSYEEYLQYALTNNTPNHKDYSVFEEGIEYYKSIITNNENNGLAWFKLGMYQRNIAVLQKTLEKKHIGLNKSNTSLKKSLDLKVNEYYVWTIIGNNYSVLKYIELKKTGSLFTPFGDNPYDIIVMAYTSALEIKPNSPYLHLMLGKHLRMSAEFYTTLDEKITIINESIQHIKQTVDMDAEHGSASYSIWGSNENSATIWSELGKSTTNLALIQRSQYKKKLGLDEAIIFFKKAIELDSKKQEYHEYLSRLERLVGKSKISKKSVQSKVSTTSPQVSILSKQKSKLNWAKNILTHVKSRWKYPSGTEGMEAKVKIKISSSGYIIGEIEMINCDGHLSYCNSVKQALRNAVPLPKASRNDLEQTLVLTFNNG